MAVKWVFLICAIVAGSKAGNFANAENWPAATYYVIASGFCLLLAQIEHLRSTVKGAE